MRVEVFGALRVRTGADWFTPSSRLQRALLATLALHPDRPVSPEELAEAMWGSDRDDRRTGMAVHVHRLRKTTSPDLIVHDTYGYRFGDEVELDAAEFEQAARQALQPGQAPETVLDLAARALTTWRGRPYPGIAGEAVEAEADRLEELRLVLLEHRFEALLATGQETGEIDDLAALARDHPLREGLQAALMTALDRNGRRSDALATYRATRHALVDELGIEPGPHLRTLHERILAGEPATEATPATPAIPVPAQLPPPPTMLTGREQDLLHLDKALAGDDDRPSLLVLTGTAGVGKTALALAWAHQHHEEFPDGQLYVNLRGFSDAPPVEPRPVLLMFLRALAEAPPPGMTVELPELTGLLRTALSRRRMLLVLDNAASVDQVRPLLPGAGSCAVLVTSRLTLSGLSTINGARQHNLDALDGDAAVELLARIVGDRVQDDEEAWWELVRHCGHLPLGIRILAEHVRDRPEEEPAVLLRELRDEAARLDLLGGGEDTGSDIRAVLSWSYEALAPTASRVFRALGLLPGRRADHGALAALTDLPEREVRRAVTALRQAHLVDEPTPGWFTQHDVLRAYAVERALEQGPQGPRDEAMQRLLGYYVLGAAHALSLALDEFVPEFTAEGVTPPDLPDAQSAHDWIRGHARDIVACSTLPPEPAMDRRIDELARLFGTYQVHAGLGSVGMALHHRALDAAHRLGDPLSVSRLERLVGTTLGRHGEVEEGTRYLEQSLGTALEAADPIGAASSLNNLGVIAGLGGRHAEAIEWFTQAAGLEEGHHVDDLLPVTRVNHAEALVKLGRHAEARAMADQVLDHRRSTGTAEGSSGAFALEVLARAHLGMGDTHHARQLAEQGHRIVQQTRNLRREAYLLITLGAVELQDDHHELALEHFRSAAELAAREAHPAIRVEALVGAARSAIALGSPDADSYIEIGLGLAERLGLPAQVEELESLLEPELSAGTAPAAGSC